LGATVDESVEKHPETLRPQFGNVVRYRFGRQQVAVDLLDAALAAGNAVGTGDELAVAVEVLPAEVGLAGLGVVGLEDERAERVAGLSSDDC